MSPPSVAAHRPRSTGHGARRLPVGIALIILCIFGMVALPYWSAGRTEEVHGELRETLGPLETGLEQVHREVLGLANDVRGLWLTGDRRFVANLVSSDAAIRAGFLRARDLAARSDPSLATDVIAAEHRYLVWLDGVRPDVERGGAATAETRTLVGASGGQLDAFTVQMERATARVRAREGTLRDRSAELRRVERAVILILGTLASIVVAYLTWLAIALLRAQRQALEERDQLEAVLAAVDSGILLLDRDLRIAMANERAAELLGVPLRELVGADQRELARDRLLPRLAEPRVFQRRLDYLLDNPEAVYEDVVDLARPRSRTLSRYGSAVRDRTGAVLGRIEVYRDVTDSLRRERELADANQRKDRFVATLSHELRTPLTPILGWIELLRDERDPRQLERGLEAIRRNVELEAQLVEDLLDLSRIVNRKLQLEFGPMDVGQAVEAAVETVRHLADGKGVPLEVRLPSPAVSVHADETRFIQVIWNLLSNAVKFTPAGGRVRLAAAIAGERLRVVVEDEGEGIPPDFLEHIFKPFEQGYDRRRYGGGLGIGLALARSLVELHGGDIVAESEGVGKGARFTFWIPRWPGVGGVAPVAAEDLRRERPARVRLGPRARPAAPVGVPRDGGDGRGPSCSSRRVLVVEDNPDTLEAMRVLLESWGFEVTAVDNVPAALEHVRARSPEAIISDIGMPDVDGLALAAEVRRVRRERDPGGEVLLIAITGFASKADRERALGAGFDAYLTKPINFAALRSLLESARPPQLEPQRA